jgi:D-allulose-6-phosphate 3-epimerase
VFIVGTSGLFNHAENIGDAWQLMAGADPVGTKRGRSSCKNSLMS